MKSFVLYMFLTSAVVLIQGRRLGRNEVCPQPGFFRDQSDCTKFYRCAEHDTKVEGLTYISKHEFNCPAGTVFDESLSVCNHFAFTPNLPPECKPAEPQLSEGNNQVEETDPGRISSHHLFYGRTNLPAVNIHPQGKLLDYLYP